MEAKHTATHKARGFITKSKAGHYTAKAVDENGKLLAIQDKLPSLEAAREFNRVAITEASVAAIPLRITERKPFDRVTYEIRDANGRRLFDIGESAGRDLVAFIVRACNAHDELVKALQDARLAVSFTSNSSGILDKSRCDWASELLVSIDAALSAAGAA
jgi:hypothetical protein